MDELAALRAVMTPEQRAQHDLLCQAFAAGVMTESERAHIEELARSDKWQAFLADLRLRLRRGSMGTGSGGH